MKEITPVTFRTKQVARWKLSRSLHLPVHNYLAGWNLITDTLSLCVKLKANQQPPSTGKHHGTHPLPSYKHLRLKTSFSQ
ncbi:hypothetical protein PGIGA_G00219160 [Pangasianodon gigas]|uniref:Uncharacterized protein n=1 Tax=Pangasianodon gigas TaxID=30993 RepID=A0ACC5WI60_PANGG|nr:hypothetical protein [Pangasianodon gigas]